MTELCRTLFKYDNKMNIGWKNWLKNSYLNKWYGVYKKGRSWAVTHLRFICSHCIFIYDKYVILLCFVINHHKDPLISNFCINLFVIFCNKMFCCRKVHIRPPKSFDHQQKGSIERRGYIRGRLIVVRKIVTLI